MTTKPTNRLHFPNEYQIGVLWDVLRRMDDLKRHVVVRASFVLTAQIFILAVGLGPWIELQGTTAMVNPLTSTPVHLLALTVFLLAATVIHGAACSISGMLPLAVKRPAIWNSVQEGLVYFHEIAQHEDGQSYLLQLEKDPKDLAGDIARQIVAMSRQVLRQQRCLYVATSALVLEASLLLAVLISLGAFNAVFC